MGAQREVSEDLTQNLFYRILKYRGSYREGESVGHGYIRLQGTSTITSTMR
jgi:hypothetical protein